MNADPSAELQTAVYQLLTGAASLAALVGDPPRVYDHVPKNAAYPYLSIGEDQVVGDDTDCGSASEVFVTIHVWSRRPGFLEAKRIASAVRSTLHDVALAMPSFQPVLFEFRDARHLVDPDGLTRHSVVTFRGLIDEVA